MRNKVQNVKELVGLSLRSIIHHLGMIARGEKVANEINGIRTNGHSRARRALNHAELRSTGIREKLSSRASLKILSHPVARRGICVLSGI